MANLDNTNELRAMVFDFRHRLNAKRVKYQEADDTYAELLTDIMIGKCDSGIDTIDEIIASQG